jgi:hypothetical protein
VLRLMVDQEKGDLRVPCCPASIEWLLHLLLMGLTWMLLQLLHARRFGMQHVAHTLPQGC